jgi:hypothetical protein
MRAAAIFGLGTSTQHLDRFRAGSATTWIEGLPSSASDTDAVVIFGGDGTIHRHLSALVRLELPVLVVPSGSGNDFARALNLRSVRDSLRAWRDFESGRVQPRAIDLGVIRQGVSPEITRYFVALQAVDSTLPSPGALTACRAGSAATADMYSRSSLDS